jgi:hypothetical protein
VNDPPHICPTCGSECGEDLREEYLVRRPPERLVGHVCFCSRECRVAWLYNDHRAGWRIVTKETPPL